MIDRPISAPLTDVKAGRARHPRTDVILAQAGIQRAAMAAFDANHAEDAPRFGFALGQHSLVD